MHDAAVSYLSFAPEQNLGRFLPDEDPRYMRNEELGRPLLHWRALMLAYVGLIIKDYQMINHALRHLMCMIDTPNWFHSAEHVVPTMTWDTRSFLPEATSTTVAILWDLLWICS